MSKDINNHEFTGRLTRDPEPRNVGDSSVVNFGLAVNRDYKNKAGEWIKKTLFVDMQAWNGVGKIILDYLHKGDFVWTRSEMDMNEWEDKEGNKRQTPRFTVLDWRKYDLVKAVKKETIIESEEKEAASAEPAKKRGRPAVTKATPKPPGQEDDEDPDDIPF